MIWFSLATHDDNVIFNLHLTNANLYKMFCDISYLQSSELSEFGGHAKTI